MDLKLVYTTPNKITAEMIKGYLEKHGIKALIEANPGPEGAFLGNFGGHAPFNPWLVYVKGDEAEEAKKLLSDFSKNK